MSPDTPLSELVRLLAEGGHHRAFVVEERKGNGNRRGRRRGRERREEDRQQQEGELERKESRKRKVKRATGVVSLSDVLRFICKDEVLLPLLPSLFGSGKGAREERKPQQNLKIKKNMSHRRRRLLFFLPKTSLSFSLSSPRNPPSTRAATRFPAAALTRASGAAHSLTARSSPPEARTHLSSSPSSAGEEGEGEAGAAAAAATFLLRGAQTELVTSPPWAGETAPSSAPLVAHKKCRSPPAAAARMLPSGLRESRR